jgi:YbbR domain-containing protein
MTVTPAPRPPSAPFRRVTDAFTERVALKATAVFVAIVIWFVVNAKEPQIELVPVRFTPILDSSLVLRDQVPQIQAIVAGSPKELIKLNSSLPTIKRPIAAGAPDTLVIDLRPQDVTLPEGVEAVVREVEPRSVTLKFETTWPRKVPVSSAIDVAVTSGLPGPTRMRIDPSVVEVGGPRNLVAKIKTVRTIKTTIPFPDSLPHLVDLDTLGLGPGVRVHPNQVKVMVVPVATMKR